MLKVLVGNGAAISCVYLYFDVKIVLRCCSICGRWKRFDSKPDVRGWQPVDAGREADGTL